MHKPNKRYKKRLSLLLLKAVLVSAILLGSIISILQIIVDANETSKLMDQKFYSLLDVFQEPASRAILTDSYDAGNKLLTGLLSINGILSARITSTDNSYLTNVTNKLFYSRYRVVSDVLFSPTRNYAIDLYIDTAKIKSIGKLSLTIDTAYTGKAFIQRSVIVFLGGVLRSLLMALVLSLIYHLLLTRPLNRLINQLRNINPENDNNRMQVPALYKKNEIGLLVDTANNLLNSIHNHYSMRREAESQIATLSEYDYTTRLPNRASLAKYLDKKIKKNSSYLNKISISCLGIDDFKELNAHVSFNAAEHILLQLSHRLQSVLIKDCYIGKLGEDQFLIISEAIVNPGDIANLAKKLLQQLHQPFTLKNEDITLQASVGISLFPEDGANSEELLQHAEFAMVQAKLKNSSKYQFYLASINEKARKQNKIESELRYAFEKKQFLLLFQPLVNLAEKKIIGVESLLRWHHPTMGTVYPEVFIPILEKTLGIIPVGNWVLEESFRQLRQWYMQGLTDLKISVNLSAVQFQYDNLIETIAKLLKQYQIPSNKIDLEVTESYILEDIDSSRQRLKQLKALGLNLAIDDFGTGYSSLSYLQKFPFDKIKIDKSFIDGLPDNKENSVIVNSIIQLCKNFNLIVLAEGVETKEQESFLLKNGCDEGQGYLYAKPISSKKILALIKNYNS